MHPPTHAHMHKACTKKKKKKGLGRGGGVQVPGLVATVRARRHLPQPGCESSRQGKDQKYTRDSQVFRADGKAQVHGDVWLKGSNGKLKKTTTEQTFFYVEAGRMWDFWCVRQPGRVGWPTLDNPTVIKTQEWICDPLPPRRITAKSLRTSMESRGAARRRWHQWLLIA